MKPLVIYHGDCPDGYCAAWVISLSPGYQDAEFLAARYGDHPPNVAGRDVTIIDFSYSKSEIEELHRQANSMKLLDHHRTAQEQLGGLSYCLLDNDRSGAMLAYDEIYKPTVKSPSKNVFEICRYIQDHDLWFHQLPETKAVCAYLHALPRDDPKFFATWTAVSERGLDNNIKNAGEALLLQREQYIASQITNVEMGVIGDNLFEVICAPRLWISYLLTSIIEQCASGRSAGWYRDGDGLYHYSLRGSKGYPVRQIAEVYGGGGHEMAAGFISEKLVHTHV
ncbi:MAG: hypothetical protein ACPGO0_04095 [Acidimicrobiales bacterium]